MPFVPNPWLILGALAFCAAAWFQGYRMGEAACEASFNERELKRIEEGERLKDQRRELETRLDDALTELEIERNEDPVTVVQCLSPSRVRRIESVR